MLDIDKLYYIMDYSGNYYRINDRNDLVVVKNANEAAVFSFIDANKRINNGPKSKFYLMIPVDDVEEEYPSDEAEMKTVGGNLTDVIISEVKEVKSTVEFVEKPAPAPEYDLTQIDWKEYLTHFTYVIEALGGYRESLIKAESDADLEICDILHYIELYDISDEESAKLVNLLKECREYRRDVKDEIIRLDAFQRTVGTSANVAKAKEAIKAIQKLETRRYTPRKLSELFENKVVKMSTSGEKPYREMDSDNAALSENSIEMEETEDMDLVRRDTVFDEKDNDWLAFAMQQAMFYRDANQYIVNIMLDIEEIEQEISDLMDEIDSSNCNVTQGYKLFKRLKELRTQRKEKEKELQCLSVLTEHFDMSAMANECENNAYELERLLYPEEIVDKCDETQISEDDTYAEIISKAV